MASRRGPDNSVRVAIQGVRNTVPWANVFWCQLSTSGSISQADLDLWLTAFANQYKTSFAPRSDTGVTYSLAVATLFTPGGGVLQSSSAMTGAGTEAGTAITDNAYSKVISWLSTVYWRGGKPRTYIPGGTASDLTGARLLTSTEQTALVTAGNGFRTAINALTQGTITATVLGFVSFTSGSVARVPPLFFAVTGSKSHPRIGTQRRRLGKWQP